MKLAMNKTPKTTEKAIYTEQIFYICLQIVCSHFILIKESKRILETFFWDVHM